MTIDLSERSPAPRSFKAHTGQVSSLATFLLGDRRYAISAGRDKLLKIWDLNSGSQVGSRLIGHTDWINAISLTTQSGRVIAVSGSDDETLRLWDIEAYLFDSPRGEEVHPSSCASLAVGPIDRQLCLISTNQEGTEIRVRELATGQSVGEPIAGFVRRVHAIAACTLERSLIIGANRRNGLAVLRGASSGRLVHATEVSTTQMDMDPNVLIARERGMVEMVSAHSGRIRIGNHTFVGTYQATPRIDHRDWRVVSNGMADIALSIQSFIHLGVIQCDSIAVHKLHDAEISSLAVEDSLESSVVVTTYEDGWLLMHSLKGIELVLLHAGLQDHVMQVISLRRAQSGLLLASGSNDGRVTICDLFDRGAGMKTLEAHAGNVSAVALANLCGKEVLVSSGEDGYLVIQQIGRKGSMRINLGHPIESICIAPPDGIAVGFQQGVILLRLLRLSE